MAPPPGPEVPITVGAAMGDNARGFSWLSNAGIVKLNLMLLLFQISSYATGYDGSMMNGLQSLDTWKDYFHHPGASELGLLNAIQNVGQLVALPFCAISCDKFGRRPALIFSAFVILIGVALQGAAQNVGMFIAARGIIGLGLALNITAAPLLLLELAFPKQQGPIVGIYNSLWNLGSLVAAWITYGTFRMGDSWAWRIPSLLQGLSSIVQICLCFLVEESPRWLISQERDAEARRLITKYHADGDASDPAVALEMEEIRTALRLEAEYNRTTSYLSFFATRGNRRRLAIILAVSFFSQWSGNGLISYYLTLILDAIGYTSEATQTLINALLTVWSMAWSLFFSVVVNRFGRRTLFLASTAGCLVIYVVWTALEARYEQLSSSSSTASSETKPYAAAVLAMIFLYNLCFSIGWTPLQVVYVMEILPYRLRARGLVLYNLFVSLALIFNQYANPVGLARARWRYYLVYDVWLALELVLVYFLFVDTGASSLEETAAVIDGVEYGDRLVGEAVRDAEEVVGGGGEKEGVAETKEMPPATTRRVGGHMEEKRD